MWLVCARQNEADNPYVAIPMPEGSVVIGRGEGSDLAILDAHLSRRHLTLTREGTTLRFVDAGSSKGTRLQGELVKEGELPLDVPLEIGGSLVWVSESTPKARKRGPRAEGSEGDGAEEGPESLTGMIKALRGCDDARQMLERLLGQVVGLFGAERGFVLLQDRGGKKLLPVASHAIADPQGFAAVSSTVTHRAMTEGALIFIHDTAIDDSVRSALTFAADDRARSILACPLQADGKSFGVIYLDMPLLRRIIPPAKLELFEAVTAFVSERLAGAQTRKNLFEARGQIAAMNRLAWEGDRLVQGEGPASKRLAAELQASASQDTTVLIFGETGTGKEMAARSIHRMSDRKEGPFIPVNCAALPQGLIDAELFGSEKGAFTGATEQKKGRFELANGGTLFLDEIGELPLDFQVKMLRVLQERSVTRLGGSEEIPLDFRLICATNRDLEEAVREGRFRSDFYFRINVFRINLTPLRERPEDIEPLATHFLATFARRFSKKLKGFTEEALALLRRHPWPGNIRELRNAVERAVVIEQGLYISPENLPVASSVSPAGGGGGFQDLPLNVNEARDVFEQAFLERSLDRNGGNISAVVRESGLARPTVYRWLERFGLDAKSF